MKDFCKWLGVNEKIAKIVVWIFIFMCMLIITNIMLESVGLSYYKLTANNLSKITTTELIDYILGSIITLLNYYSVIFLVFRVKAFKQAFNYSIIYLLFNIIITSTFGKIANQIFIFAYIVLFCYLFSQKNWKYLLYGIGSYIINVFVQFICYLYKVRFINFNEIGYLDKFLTSFDFFIIMFVIIMIKEIIIKRKEKKRGE